MLADGAEIRIQSGIFASDIHPTAAFRRNLVDFIHQELPKWRDHPKRPLEQAETVLTSQLCAHLNSATRMTPGWDILQFRIEEPDERQRGRKIDLIPAPSGTTIWIDGRAYTHYDALLPIECKRLPVPVDPRRDAREYLYSETSSAGGIQRFKAGHHGAAHNEALMIAYVQSDTLAFWVERVREWLVELIASNTQGWTAEDALRAILGAGDHVCRLESTHTRAGALEAIALTHLWIDMQPERGRQTQ